MDDDTFEMVMVMIFMGSILALPFFIILAVSLSMTYSKTLAWDKARKEKQARLDRVEEQPLVEEDGDLDFVDTEDEEDYQKRKVEEENDESLTFKQKFWKEWKKPSNQLAKDEQKKKEREERKKLAKAVARQLDRMQRKRDGSGQAGPSNEADTDLPTYKTATQFEKN